MAASSPALASIRFSDLAHHLEEQIRGSTDGGTVNRYRLAMQNGDEFPPLLVAEIGGALVLVDGFHRRDAMEALGWEEAPARIVPCRSLLEARWMGFDANLRHGQPLRPKLLRQALRAFLDAGHHRWADGRFKSYREIARELSGVSYSTVRRWIEADAPALFKAMGGAGGEGVGGTYELPAEATPEESLAEAALAHIGEARALLQGVTTAGLRQRAAVEAEALLRELTWDEAVEPDLSAYLNR